MKYKHGDVTIKIGNFHDFTINWWGLADILADI
jgi:hypothetical protein